MHAELLGIRALVMLLQAMPFRAATGFAKVVGWILYVADGRHRRIALENLARAFGDELSERKRRRLARASFEHLVLVGAEMAHLLRCVKRHNWQQHIVVRNADRILKALPPGRGGIFVTGHVGNWEVLGWVVSQLGYPLHVVMRPMDNPLLDDLINDFRRGANQVPVAKAGALTTLVRALRDGKHLGILVDQDARNAGVFVDFFGIPASTTKAVAFLALAFDTPILIGYARRLGRDFKFEVFVDEPIYPRHTGNRDEDVRWLTQEFTSRIESYVRRCPDRWLWMHRRWKTRPPEEPRAARRLSSAEA